MPENHRGWRRGSESNRRIKVLQTSPLPLGYRAPAQSSARTNPSAEHEQAGIKRNLERETGFEPATSTLARSHSTTELLPLDEENYTAFARGNGTAASAVVLRPLEVLGQF